MKKVEKSNLHCKKLPSNTNKHSKRKTKSNFHTLFSIKTTYLILEKHLYT